MNFTKGAYTVSLLIVALGFVMAPQSNASLAFNGATSKAVLDGYYLDGTNHSTYTFEVWIKPYDLATGGTLIRKSAEYWKEWALHVSPDGGLWLGGAWPDFYWGAEIAAGSITTNVWQHVCCAVANGQASFYVNGNLVGTEAVQDPVDFYAAYPLSSAPLLDAAMCIGYADNGTVADGDFFNGLIYGIRVWSRTLSASEVSAIATTGVAPSTNGLYNAVLLNEGSGTTIHDSLTSLTGRVLTAQWTSDNPTFPSGSLTNGLVAWWKADSNAADSASTNNATMYGVTFAPGISGQAFVLSGCSALPCTSGFLTVPPNEAWNFGSNDFSIVLWANFAPNTGPWQSIAASTFLSHDNVNDTKWIFMCSQGNLYFHIKDGPTSTGLYPVTYPAMGWSVKGNSNF